MFEAEVPVEVGGVVFVDDEAGHGNFQLSLKFHGAYATNLNEASISSHGT